MSERGQIIFWTKKEYYCIAGHFSHSQMFTNFTNFCVEKHQKAKKPYQQTLNPYTRTYPKTTKKLAKQFHKWYIKNLGHAQIYYNEVHRWGDYPIHVIDFTNKKVGVMPSCIDFNYEEVDWRYELSDPDWDDVQGYFLEGYDYL